MLKTLCTKILFGWLGFTETVTEPLPPKCIIALAPHTSNWDFIIGNLYSGTKNYRSDCLMKKEWFFWPMGILMRKLGGIPVNRSKGSNVVLSVIKEMKAKKLVHLALAPEGTRQPVKRWKTGFHTIAREVGCPVYMGYFDWGTKRIGRGQKVELTDDARADMERIQALYEEMHLVGKHPEMYITH